MPMHSEHVTQNEESWPVYLKRGALALFICFTLIFFVYAYMRVKQIYENQVELATIKAEYSELLRIHTAQLEELQKREDITEKLLYGDVLAKLAKQPSTPTGLELWQRNRDREFRERLSSLERRFMTLERRAERLQ